MREKTARRNLYIVGLISFLNVLTLGAIIPIIYTYASSFGLSDSAIGILFGTFSIAQFVATPVIGRLSDKYGRKPLLIISLFGTCIASLIQGFALNGGMLFLGRFLDGITGGNNSVAQAIIADSASEEDRPLGFAIFGASFGLGFLFGPVLALIIAQFGNSYVFFFSSALALFTTIITYLFLPETNKNKETKKLDVFETLFLQCLKALKMPIIRDILILNFITAFSISVFQVGFQPYLKANFGLGQEYVSYVLILSGIINIVFLGFVKISAHKYGLSTLLTVVSFLRLIVFLGLAIYINYYFFWIMMVVFAFVNLFSRPVISSMLTKYTKKEDQGTVIGVAESLFSLGLAVGPSLFALSVVPLDSSFSFLNISFVTQLLSYFASQYTLSFYAIALISLVAFIYVVKFTSHLKTNYRIHKKEIDF